MSESFKNTHRSTCKDFTRNCLVTFPMLILFILNLIRRSLQAELNKFCPIVALTTISKQVFSAARKKILPTAFVELNDILVHEFYNDNKLQTYRDFRLLVVDGSTLQLPEGDSIREKYGSCSGHMSMARISHAYDPLNRITLDAIMSPYATAERSMAFNHILNIQPSSCAKDLYLFDRGYPSISLICFLFSHGKDFLMRASTAWLSLVNDVLASGKKDVIIEISGNMTVGKQRKEFRDLFPDVDLKKTFKVRIIVITLSTGEKEVLVTSLIDKVKYKYKIFKDLYHLRWGGEENYKFHKVRIEIENFSGKTPQAIEQDFHASVFTANVRALLAEEAQEELNKKEAKKQHKHVYIINKNISIGILKNAIVKVLFNPKADLEKFCNQMKQDMKKSVIPIRPGRTYEHIKKSSHKYPMNRRRAI